MAAAESKPLDAAIIREAARWLVRLHSGEAGPADHAAFERWRAGSPDRELAWQRAQRLTQQFNAVPAALGVPLLTREPRVSRRTVLRTLAAMGFAAPAAAWLGYRVHYGQEGGYRTAVGESHDLMLADGSEVLLNTDTGMDVRYSDAARVVQLRSGEVYVRTAADKAVRPFYVETPQGRLQALGTRFVVRQRDGRDAMTELTVLEHRVAVTLANGGSTRVFSAGESVRFTAQAFLQGDLPAAAPLRAGTAPGWTRGVIEADNMRLDALLAEVARYRRGVVRCDPDVAGLRVSGVFRLENTDALLAVVANTLDLRVVTRTSYWVTLGR
ncbi:FecR domain-containing protein [Achromobacter sp. ACRQX]|uniref:FecR domain-containing protein n=1 Tax=Achromobacter sp. ACRQX TaxID=2918181 RepID=UPI001EF35068|nr:FecR domain-containing protein [Achromobacter sp. ACRQX]MCG7326091.1 FecR domain-containing protein [Achromobacter sp. ACRQX]